MAVRIMGEKQLNTKLTDDEVKYIVAFLNSLTGEMKSFALPVLPPSTQLQDYYSLIKVIIH